MPYLLIQTNKPLGENEQSQLLADASKVVAALLNKPEKCILLGRLGARSKNDLRWYPGRRRVS